jgi:hypothetical protein
MSIPKEKNRATQLAIAAIVGVAFWMPFRGLWWLLVSDPVAIWLAAPSSIAFAAAFYWWYGHMQDSMQD